MIVRQQEQIHRLLNQAAAEEAAEKKRKEEQLRHELWLQTRQPRAEDDINDKYALKHDRPPIVSFLYRKLILIVEGRDKQNVILI